MTEQKTRFNRGETVTLDLRIQDYAGNLFDPSELPVVDVTDPDGTSVVTAQNMVRSDTGIYGYDVDTDTDWLLGTYTTKYTVTDQAHETIQWYVWSLVH